MFLTTSQRENVHLAVVYIIFQQVLFRSSPITEWLFAFHIIAHVGLAKTHAFLNDFLTKYCPSLLSGRHNVLSALVATLRKQMSTTRDKESLLISQRVME